MDSTKNHWDTYIIKYFIYKYKSLYKGFKHSVIGSANLGLVIVFGG